MSNTPAFAGTTVVSTRKDSGIDGVILRRRKATDGTRFTTAEVPEAMLELLLTVPGGLKRNNTAINPDNVTRAKALHDAGTPRAEAEKQLGVASGTYRRLLAAAGVELRKYTNVLTEDNIQKALRVSVKYNFAERSQLIKAAKEIGTNSRTMRRLLSRALETMTPEAIAEVRNAELARLSAVKAEADAAVGQLSIDVPVVSAPAEVPPAPAPTEIPHRRASDNAPVPAIPPAVAASIGIAVLAAADAAAHAPAELPPAAAVVPAGDVPVMDTAPAAE